MKAKEIMVGGKYLAKVNSRETIVRVDDIRTGTGHTGKGTTYYVTNLRTGRHTTFHSSRKFRAALQQHGCPKCKTAIEIGDKPRLLCVRCEERMRPYDC